MTRLPRRWPGTALTATPELAVLAPTRLEAWAARRAMPAGVPVYRVGVGLSHWQAQPATAIVVCGLAGSLTDELAPGSVVVPERVGLPSGSVIACDHLLFTALVKAARALGFEPACGLLLTAPEMLTGARRREWAERGFVAADMESALAVRAGSRLGVVRVVLDSPSHEVSGVWLRPLAAAVRPWLWPQAIRLGTTAPRYALRAAKIVALALAGAGS